MNNDTTYVSGQEPTGGEDSQGVVAGMKSEILDINDPRVSEEDRQGLINACRRFDSGEGIFVGSLFCLDKMGQDERWKIHQPTH